MKIPCKECITRAICSSLCDDYRICRKNIIRFFQVLGGLILGGAVITYIILCLINIQFVDDNFWYFVVLVGLFLGVGSVLITEGLGFFDYLLSKYPNRRVHK